MTQTLLRVGKDGYRRTMRNQATGVAVVTTTLDGEPVGFCAGSVASVSLEPPMLSFAVTTTGSSGRAWSRAEGGIVHLLHGGQADLARAFSRTGEERFGGRFPWAWSSEGYPELADRLALLAVRTVTWQTVGDHLLVVAEVSRVDEGQRRGPLVYTQAGFARVVPSPCDTP